MGHLTSDRLLELAAESKDGNTGTVEILGGTVLVRGLTAAEDAKIAATTIEQKQSRRGDGTTTYRPDSRQRLIVKYGLIDPKLDENQLTRLLTTAGAREVSKIVRKVVELSGGDGDEEETADEKAAAAFPESD